MYFVSRFSSTILAEVIFLLFVLIHVENFATFFFIINFSNKV